MFGAKYFNGLKYVELPMDNSATSVSFNGNCANLNIMEYFVKYTKGDEADVHVITEGKLGSYITDWFTEDDTSYNASTLTKFQVDLSSFDSFRVTLSLSAPTTKSGSDTLGVGDGTETSFSGTLTNYPIPGQVEVHYTIGGTPYVATDDGAGNITGTSCSGTIDYNTKEISVNFTTPPDNGTNVDVIYAIAGTLILLTKPKKTTVMD